MIPLGEAPFEMCWFYMGFAQIALDPTIKWANVEKSALNHPGKPLYPPPLRTILNCPYRKQTLIKLIKHYP